MPYGDTRRWRHGKLLGNQNAKRDGTGRFWGRSGMGRFWRRCLSKARRAVERLHEKQLQNLPPEEVLETVEQDEDARIENKLTRPISIVKWKCS